MNALSGLGRKGPQPKDLADDGSPSIIEHLLRVDVLRGMSREEIAMLFGWVKPEEYPAGTRLFSADSSSEMLFILKTGHVEVYRLTPEGKRLVISRFGPGTIFGEMRMLGQTLRGAFAEASEPVLVCIVTKDRLLEVLRRRPDVTIRILEVVGSHVVQLEERLEQALFSPVRARLASFLLTTMDPFTSAVSGYSHEDIGDTIGALRQTVTEALSVMREEGLVKVQRKQIRVVERQKLEQIILDQNG